MRAIICGAILLALICFGAPTVSGADITARGRLDRMLSNADLVFKGQVVASTDVSNNAFHISTMEVHATQFKVISVLQGAPPGDTVMFEHYTRGPTGGWGGPAPPAYYQLEPGQTCLVIAAKMSRPDRFFTPQPGGAARSYQLRQIADSPSHPEDGLIRTLDTRPLAGLAVKDAIWQELMLMLHDTHPSNALYAIDRLDGFSLAPDRHFYAMTHTDDFKREDVLDAVLPLLTNASERVANRAIDCFADDAGSPLMTAAYLGPLLKAANEAPSSWTRYFAVKALSGGSNSPMTNALARLLVDPDENVRLCAVTLLPGYPRDFAESALRARAQDASPYVRSVVADVIGEGQYADELPALAALFAGSTAIPSTQQKPLPNDALNPRPGGNGTGDVHGDAALALTRFDTDQVAGILKSNLNDADYHVLFIAKLAEKDAGPWLTELTNILQTRIAYVNDIAKLAPTDPRKYSDFTSSWVLTGAYADCWNDLCRYLQGLPREKFTAGELDRYMDLLERAAPSTASLPVSPVHSLYELYQTHGLPQRTARLRQGNDNEKWWFEDFDEHHPELNPAK